MNLNEFEKNNETKNSSEEGFNNLTSFVENEAHIIKQKIEKRKIKQRKLKLVTGGVVILFVLLLIAFGYSQYKLYKISQDEKVSETTPNNIAMAKTGEEVVKALTRHILVPEGVPQIAEVQDVEKLKEKQVFFKDAQNGDVVVMYQTAIFIYRPSKDIVIAVGDLQGVNQVKP